MTTLVLPRFKTKYPVGFAGNADAEPADPTVVCVVAEAKVRSPKMIGCVMVLEATGCEA
jgi:hypothetical protein